MRRHLRSAASVALVAVLGVAGAACGSSSKSSTGSKSSGAADAAECPVDALTNYDASKGKIKVPLWFSLTGKSKDALEQIAKEYNASQSKVEVEPQVQGKSYDEVLTKYLRAIPSKQLPAAAYIEDTKMQTMVDSDTVLPADACMKASGLSLDSIYPDEAVRNYYTVQGRFYPSALNVSEPILYFNKALFQKAGLDPTKPPTTLEELRKAAEKLKAAGVDKPFVLKLDPWFIECWLGGQGVDMVNNGNGRKARATASAFDTPQLKDLLTFLKGMQDEGLLFIVPKTDGNIDQYLALADPTKSAMLIETSTAAVNIMAVVGGDVDPSEVGAGGITLDPSKVAPEAAPLPGVTAAGKARVSGGAFYMMKTSSPEVQAATWDFMRFMLQVPQQVMWHLEGSYLPAVKGVSEDPKVRAFWKTSQAGKMLSVADSELRTIDPARPGALIGPASDFEKSIRQMLEGIFQSGKSIDQGIADAKTQADKAIATYNEDNGVSS